MSRTIVIGDVHGCYDELKDLLDATDAFARQTEIVFLGDLMDRGPDPVGCVRLVRSVPTAKCIMGNHEDKHLRWAKHEKNRKETGKKNPMTPFDDKKLREHNALSEDDLKWMSKLPATYCLAPGWIAVHGGFEQAYPLDHQNYKTMIRCRYVDVATGKMASADNPYEQPEGTVHWADAWRGGSNVVYGHFCEELGTVRIRGWASHQRLCNAYGIDTGACFGGTLTAMVLHWGSKKFDGGHQPQIQFVQVPAHGTYRDWKGGKD